jgi:hypothetical protein
MNDSFHYIVPLLLYLTILTAGAPHLRQRKPHPSIMEFPPLDSTSGGLTWSACDLSHFDTGTTLPPTLQCANFSVPMDWDEPSGDRITLGLVRLPRPENSTIPRVGSLFINPGGPGGESSLEIINIGTYLTSSYADILNAFDLIGLDSRGVGLSPNVKCNEDIEKERVSRFPATQEEYDELVDKYRRYGESCQQLTGTLLGYVDTKSVAKVSETSPPFREMDSN